MFTLFSDSMKYDETKKRKVMEAIESLPGFKFKNSKTLNALYTKFVKWKADCFLFI